MLIVEVMPAVVNGRNGLKSVLTAEQIKRCFDLGIPCWISNAGGTADNSYRAFVPITNVMYTEDVGDTNYAFVAGEKSFHASAADDPIIWEREN